MGERRAEAKATRAADRERSLACLNELDEEVSGHDKIACIARLVAWTREDERGRAALHLGQRDVKPENAPPCTCAGAIGSDPTCPRSGSSPAEPHRWTCYHLPSCATEAEHRVRNELGVVTRERDDARQLLTGRTVSCVCGGDTERMRAVVEAARAVTERYTLTHGKVWPELDAMCAAVAELDGGDHG